jgi:hypothetical protein
MELVTWLVGLTAVNFTSVMKSALMEEVRFRLLVAATKYVKTDLNNQICTIHTHIDT